MIKFIWPRDGMPVVDVEAFAALTPQHLAEFPLDWIEAAKTSWHRPDGGMRQATLNGLFRKPQKQPDRQAVSS